MADPYNKFEQVIQAAIAKDASLLPTWGTVDFYCMLMVSNNEGPYTYDFTPAGYLAYQGNREAAEWLRNHHGAAISAIVKGAAQGGHIAYAEELRELGAPNISSIAFGAALGGHRVYAEELRAEGAWINTIAFGAAKGGDRAYADELRALGATIDSIANGAAKGEHLKIDSSQCAWLIAICRNDDEITKFLEVARIHVSDAIRARVNEAISLKAQLRGQNPMYALSLVALAMKKKIAPYGTAKLLTPNGPQHSKDFCAICRTTLLFQQVIQSRRETTRPIRLPHMPVELYYKIIEHLLWRHIADYRTHYEMVFGEYSFTKMLSLEPSLFHRLKEFLKSLMRSLPLPTTPHHQSGGAARPKGNTLREEKPFRR